MLAYSAPKVAGRAGSPKALTLVLIGHAAVIGAVLTAKPDYITRVISKPPIVFNVPVPPPPRPVPQIEPNPPQPITQDSFIEQERPIIDMDRQIPIELATGPSFDDIGTVIGSGPTTIIDPPRHVPVKMAARLTTSEHALKPPYPLSKRRDEEEATLRLRLSIDERGRVVAVEPVGAADPEFLEAARRHILRTWRYKPATEDGAAIPSSTVISLAFRLEDV